MVAAIIAAVALGVCGDVVIRKTDTTLETTFSIELADTQVDAIIETAEGEVEVVEVPTVESVDNNQLTDLECEEDEECGQGWYVDTSSPQTFREAVYANCVDTDGHYGSQCWDLGNLFWQNYAGRSLSTCGTGAAKGTLNCYEYNAGDEFEMIWDATQLQAGDWVIFKNGIYGHVGMALGGYNNGYVALLGTNQGGASCSGGGAAANIINISLKNFAGAFRPKAYIKVEPEPVVEPEDDSYTVVAGDTLGSIAREMGWYTEDELFGDNGYTQKLAEKNGITNRGLIYPGQVITKY